MCHFIPSGSDCNLMNTYQGKELLLRKVGGLAHGLKCLAAVVPEKRANQDPPECV